mmetsp:Transcript_22572/g.31830  ORF Transcript_22572/g.31830 Transcript_22572/m.31830 type:complete len:220 (-) Transcript_22572:2165-2824(-)
MEPPNTALLLSRTLDVIIQTAHIYIVWETQMILSQNRKFKQDMLQVVEMLWQGNNNNNNKSLQYQTLQQVQGEELAAEGHREQGSHLAPLFFLRQHTMNQLNPNLTYLYLRHLLHLQLHNFPLLEVPQQLKLHQLQQVSNLHLDLGHLLLPLQLGKQCVLSLSQMCHQQQALCFIKTVPHLRLPPHLLKNKITPSHLLNCFHANRSNYVRCILKIVPNH